MKDLHAARQELENILSGSEYRAYYKTEQTSYLQDYLKQLQEWINNILEKIFPHSTGTMPAASWLSYGITAVIVILIIVVLYFLAIKYAPTSLLLPKRSKKKGPKVAAGLPEHFNQAVAYAEQGQYSSAVRHLFLGFIAFLTEQKWLVARPWKTNWEYFAELRDKSPTAAQSFTALAHKFEEVAYGNKTLTKADYLDCSSAVSSWLKEVTRL